MGEEPCEVIQKLGQGEGKFQASTLNNHRQEHLALLREITLSFQTQDKSSSHGWVSVEEKNSDEVFYLSHRQEGPRLTR